MIKTTPYFLGANTISQTNTTNKVQDTNISNQGKSNKKQYNDPLNQWPVRGLAYSNEIGAAISEIAPKAGLLLWIPALLYFGADIYDKYKNDKNSYDPSAKRGTKQAIFQLLASVILPTAAVKVGQKTASVMGLIGKDKLSLQTQEELHRFTINYIKQNKLHNYANNQEEYYIKFAEKLANHIDETKKEGKFKNTTKKIINWIFNRKQPAAVTHSTPENIVKFTKANIEQIFKIRENLVNNKPSDGLPVKILNKFKQIKQTFEKTANYNGDSTEDAAKQVIKMLEEKKIFKNKLLKTVGGFVVLGLMAKPIDKFVESFVIDKFVEPNLSFLQKKQVDDFKNKNMTMQK